MGDFHRSDRTPPSSRHVPLIPDTPPAEQSQFPAREWMDRAIDRIRPAASTDSIAKVFPKAEEFGFADEMEAFALQFCHGLGVALHERPIVSRLVSLDFPMEIKEGMVFAIETYCPASDGASAARMRGGPPASVRGCRG